MNNQIVIKKVFVFFGVFFVIALFASVFLASLNTARNKSAGVTSVGGAGAPAYGEDFVARDSDGKNQGLPEAQVSDRKIVKNGSLSLLVKKVEDAVGAVVNITEGAEGFVQSSNVYEGVSGAKSGSITIRVPFLYFDDTVAELKEIAIEVQRESSNARDVTEQFIDLEARLKNLRAEENQYQEIMKRAVTIENTLSVASRLYDARGRIEQVEGQLKYLSDETDMSLVTISLTEEADARVFGFRWRPLVSAKLALYSMLGALASSFDVILALVIYIPVVALWFAIAFVIIMAGARITNIIKRRYFDK